MALALSSSIAWSAIARAPIAFPEPMAVIGNGGQFGDMQDENVGGLLSRMALATASALALI